MARIWGDPPPKRGGKDYTPDITDDKGALTCGACGGSGEVFREVTSNLKGDASKSDLDSMPCKTCGGKGTVE